MKKRFALALAATCLVAAGCSSDDDGDGGGSTPDTTTPDTTTPDTTPDGGGVTSGDVTTDGPMDDAGPVELAVANDPESSDFYAFIDAIFGGETLDERQTPEEAWTFLVPTNAAFQAAGLGETPDDERTLLIRRHVITSGKLSLEDLAALSEIVVNTSDSYPISGDATSLSIGGAAVLRTIAEDDNTIVYSIDGALEPTGN